ncbi:WD repeat-containing protein jip5 [Penicillium manginii]|uniref:WD repeat-containing protein jip5 n=1 Tax=Penicillium manginii TaxID=203109 RepID=UPI0025494745|nr:WD repeat-containing protein jip5 [Penicillium manginii]KAJ5732980.1 WD repeat-containing protein jip5 [Penicillium manginii]
MFESICSLPLSSDLFSQAIHPREPVVAVGLAAGHVQTFRLPSDEADDEDDAGSCSSSHGRGHIDTMWKTRRHKGSCRCLAYGVDGETLYSAGTDGLIKAANSETGKVTNKIAIPLEKNGSIDAPTVIHALSPQTLLLATDSSALHLYDLRIPYSKISVKPEQSHHPHDDYISSLTPLPASDASTSGFSKQWVTTGGTTLAVTDLRRGVLMRSEDQEEELVSSTHIGGLATTGTSRGEKVAVGGAGGVLTLWEKGAWDDQDERIYVSRDAEGGESIETMAVVPDELGHGKMIAAGLGNGQVKFVRLGANKVVSEAIHDETEGVVGLGFDVEGRMVSGGGQIVKVWHEAMQTDAGDDEMGGGKHFLGDSDDSDDSDDDKKERQNVDRKKRKKTKGKDRSGGQHVMGFADMD